MPAPGRFTVLVADFLDEASVESPVLDDIATLVLVPGDREEELADHLPEADAIMLFHDIPHLGEASFARAPRASASSAPASGYNNVDLEAASAARRDRLQRARLRHRGGRRPRDHVPAGPGPPARAVPRGDPGGDLGLPDGRRHAPAPRQDARPRRLRPDRHRDGAAGQGVRARRRLLRPAIPRRGWTRRWASAASTGSRSCSSRATSSACTATSTRRPTT